VPISQVRGTDEAIQPMLELLAGPDMGKVASVGEGGESDKAEEGGSSSKE
jgi:hypothetical protein